jgi:transcriptional regulator with XRE-family HTH domain
MQLDLKRLGENIRYLRQGKGWSLSDLSEQSGVSKPFISDLENGAGGKPNIQYLYKIAVALETTIDGLINLELSPAKKKGAKTARRHEQLPPGLEDFANEADLEPEQIDMLATLNFRGNRPKDRDAWRLIYEAIRIGSRGQG